MKCEQALGILAVVERAFIDLLVERVPGGYRASATLDNGTVYSCEGMSATDALGQLTTATALELDVDMPSSQADETVDSDQRIPFTVESAVEFCTRFVTITEEDDVNPPRIGNVDRAVLALTMMAAVGK